jgi:hypothetical protein
MFLLPLSFSMLLHSAQPDKEWGRFTKKHDMYLLIKHVNKNEDKWVRLSLADLPDDPHQATWIERADFLPIEKKQETDELLDSPDKYQGTVYEQTVGGQGKDEKFVMLMVGFFEPQEKTYRFVMDPFYHCVSVIIVEKEQSQQELFAEYYHKIASFFAETWSSIVD